MINDEKIKDFRDSLKEIDFDNDIISQNYTDDFLSYKSNFSKT